MDAELHKDYGRLEIVNLHHVGTAHCYRVRTESVFAYDR